VNDDVFVSAVTVDVCFVFHLVLVHENAPASVAARFAVVTWFVVLSCASCLDV